MVPRFMSISTDGMAQVGYDALPTTNIRQGERTLVAGRIGGAPN
jgi:hypothetical protein